MKRPVRIDVWRRMALLTSLIGSFAFGAPRDDHLAWIQPEQFTATPGAVVSLSYRRAPVFGTAGARVTLADLEFVQVQLGGEPAPAVPFARPGTEPTTLVTLTRPGYALIDVTLRSQRRTLVASEVPRYLSSLHAPDDVLALWARQPEGVEWVETRRFSLKTALKVGQPAENGARWRQVRGTGWELVPVQNPLVLGKNDRFRVQVLDEGSPVAGVLVDFVSAGETAQHVVTTDENGVAEAQLGQPGVWLIHAVDFKRIESDALEWVIDYAGYTVQVK